MEIRNISLSQYIEWLQKENFFYFPRYGDGEWRTIFETTGIVMGFQQLSPDLQRDMQKSLLDNSKSPILWGMQNHAMHKMGDRILKFLQQNKLSNFSWVNADVFHYASRDEQLFPLIKELRRHELVIVGPRFLNGLKERVFKPVKFLEISENNCYEHRKQIQEQILAVNEELGNNLVYSFSAGPAANVLITHLWNQMPKNFLIDFGSLWDIFCGYRSRRYMSKGNYSKEKLQRNLGLY